MGERGRGDGFQARVAAVVQAIPPGSVATYGEVAVEAGYAVGASRAVGNVLQQVEGLPWWRVVTSTGRLVPGLEERHAALLGAEGVALARGRVRLEGGRVRLPSGRVRLEGGRARPAGRATGSAGPGGGEDV